MGFKTLESPNDVVNAIKIVMMLTVLTLAPAILIMMTGFTRIIIVLSLFETLADKCSCSKDPEGLNEFVRRALARSITAKYTEEGGVSVLGLDPSWEDLVSKSLLQTKQGVQLVMEPHLAQQLITKISQGIENHPEMSLQPILLTNPTVRRHLRKLISRFIPQVVVLSHNELNLEAKVSSVGVVELENAS